MCPWERTERRAMLEGVELVAVMRDVLVAAGARAGVSTADARLLRAGSNVLFVLAGGVVARISRPGGRIVAGREIRMARWLAGAGLPVVRALEGVDQPTLIGDHAVTWWEELPEHRPASPGELGAMLRALHSVPIPADLGLVACEPLAGITARIDAVAWLDMADREWLRGFAAELCAEYQTLPTGLPDCVVHGDAWQGNVAVPWGGAPVLLDLEHVGVGRPEWDLVSLAVDHTDFGRIDAEEYREFVRAYGGYDVIGWAGYRTLAAIRELRWTTFVLRLGDMDAGAAREGLHRLSCLRGEVERPWRWAAY